MKGRKILSALLGVVVFLVFAAVNVNATVINVPGDYPTIQLAINAALDGDTVFVAAGTYTLTYIITMKKGVSLEGAGADGCTLIGMSAGEVIVCGTDIDESTIIEGFTITHADGQLGRGIKCENGASPVIRNNIIIGNSAGFGGGGILCKAGSSPEIRNNQIIGNNTSDIKGGGGILCWNSSPTIKDNTITGNHADLGGGGISCYYNSSPIIMHNDITGNTVSNGSGGGIGGGILCWNSSPTIKDNTITGNHADLGGGGISCYYNSSPVIINNVITLNTTSDVNSNGGGISCEKLWLNDTNEPKIANNIIAYNNTAGMGGGIACLSSTALITNNVITWNEAGGYYSGGGILCLNSSAIIINNIITKNIAEGYHQRGGIYFFGSSIPTIKSNDVWNNTVYNYNSDYTPDGSNISSDPIFKDPDNDNFHLKSGSPCIDAGYSSTGVYWIPDFDFEGDLRIIGVVDMGADEFDPLSNTPPVAMEDSYSVDEDEILSVPTSEIYGVLKNDKDDDGDTLTAVLDENVSHGTLELNPDGSFTYEPDDDFHSTDTFTYKAHDGQVYSEKATVTITVNSVNDPPVADDQSIATDEDTAISIILKATDVEKDSLTYSVVLPGPVNGTLSGTAPNLIYTPVLNYFGVDSLTFKANDGEDFSNVATVSITINPVNDPPIANAGPDQTVAANDECEAEVTLNGTGSSDVDGGELTYTWYDPFDKVIGTNPSVTVTLDKGTHVITLAVDDGNDELATDTDTVQITVEDQTPPTILLSDPILVSVGKGKGKGKGKKVSKLTVSATDNCSSDIVLTIDNVEIFNKKERPVRGKSVYYIIDGNDIYVFPKGKGWSIHVTVTATDKSGNSETDTISKTLLKYKGWSWKSFFKLLFWKCFH